MYFNFYVLSVELIKMIFSFNISFNVCKHVEFYSFIFNQLLSLSVLSTLRVLILRL